MSEAVLEITKADKSVSQITLANGTHVVGRDAGKIILSDPLASSSHAKFVVSDGGVVFSDLGSTNGSFFDGGLKIEKAYTLKVGNIINMGSCRVKFLAFNKAAEDAQSLASQKTMLAMPATNLPAAAAKPLPAKPAPAKAAFVPAKISKPNETADTVAPPAATSKASDVISKGGVDAKEAAAPKEEAAKEVAAPKEEAAKEEAAPKEDVPKEAALSTDVAAVDRPAPFGGNAQPAGFQGYLNDLLSLWKYTFAALRPRILEVMIPILLFTTALPLLNAILVQLVLLIPAIGGLLAIVLSILSILAAVPLALVTTLILYPVVARWVLAIYLGKPMTLGEAWKQHKKNFGSNLINTFVTTLLGGLTLGILGTFIFQIPFVEGKKNVEANLYSFELLRSNWKRVIFVLFLSVVAIVVPMTVAQIVLAFIPFLGAIAAAVLVGAVNVVVIPGALFLVTCLYFDIREQREGTDPRPAAKEAIDNN